MPNGMYGGVRGKETKVGQKTLVSRPTRLLSRPPVCNIFTCLYLFLDCVNEFYHFIVKIRESHFHYWITAIIAFKAM